MRSFTTAGGRRRSRTMRGVVASLGLACSLAGPAAADAAQVGTRSVHSQVQSNAAGLGQDYRFSAGSTGEVSRLNVYLAGTSTASRVELGLYSGTSTRAGTRRARCVVRTPQAGAWNRCTFSPVSIAQGSTYWLGVLQPSGTTGRLAYRRTASGTSYASSASSLGSLPATWANGANRSPNQASVFADLAPTMAGPTANFTYAREGSTMKVNFDGASSTCAAAPCTYTWLHAGTQFATGGTASFTYTGYGTKTVTLRVTDAQGRTASVDKNFDVTSVPPPTPTPTPPANPQPVGVVFNGRDLSAWNEQSCPGHTDVSQMTDATGSFIRTRVDSSGESCWGPPGGGTGSRNRAQIVAPPGSAANPLPRFQTRYYDFGVRFPAGFGDMANSHCGWWAFTGAAGLGCSGNHADREGQSIHIDRPVMCGWAGDLQKGEGWHHFVVKAYQDIGTAGRLTVWHKRPGATIFTRVINDCAIETWTNTFGNATEGSFLEHMLYHGHNDPYASNPWIDHRGTIMSTGHTIEQAAG